MFRGSYEHTVDDKGRLIVPLKFRNDLGNSFVVAKCLEGCIWICRTDHWSESVEGHLTAMSMFDKKCANLLRFLNAGMFEGTADAAGRIVLTKELREHAGIALQSEVVLVGVCNRIEIWSRKRWDDLNETLTNEYLESVVEETGLVNGPLALQNA